MRRSSTRCMAAPIGAAVSAISLTACSGAMPSKPKASSGVPPDFAKVEGFLTIESIQGAAVLDPLTAEELESEINLQGDFRSPSREVFGDESEGELDPYNECLGKKYGTAAVKAQGSMIVLEYDLDLSSCDELDPSRGEVSIHRAKAYHYGYYMSCDLSDLDGKSNEGEALAERFEACARGRHWSYTNVESTARTAGTDSKGGFTYQIAMMTEDGKPCEIATDDDGIRPGPCIHISRSNSLGMNRFVKLVGKDLESEPRSEYYSSGTYEFTINDWQGTMTYSGPLVLPKWTATRGADSAAGTYAPR